MKSTLGSICPKRSSTPRTPKSGEAEDQTAPSETVASIAATASGRLGRRPATRSPGSTPAAAAPAAGATPRPATRPRTSGGSCRPRRGRRWHRSNRRARPRRPAGSRQGSARRRGRTGRRASGGRPPAALALVANHAEEVPHRIPEGGRLRDRPAVQCRGVTKRLASSRGSKFTELSEGRFRHPVRGRCPDVSAARHDLLQLRLLVDPQLLACATSGPIRRHLSSRSNSTIFSGARARTSLACDGAGICGFAVAPLAAASPATRPSVRAGEM